MTPRQNMLAVLRGEEAEWVPWIPLLDRANLPRMVPDELRREMDVCRIALFEQTELGADILLGAGLTRLQYEGVERSFEQNGDSTIEKLTMDGRSLTSRRQRSTVGGMPTSATCEYFIKTEEDVAIFMDILSRRKLTLETSGYQEMRDRIGENGLVTPMLPRSPVMQLIIEWMGVETFSCLLADSPELVNQAIETLGGIVDETFDLALSSGVSFEVVRTHEDHDVQLTTPSTYRELISPCLRRYAEKCHQHGKLLMVHACGHVRHFLEDELNDGIDAHHYLTEPPVGNTPLRVAREIWGNRVTLMAAACPLTIVQGSVAEVSANVEHLFDEAGDGRAFMLISAMKPDMPNENLQAVRKVVMERRKMNAGIVNA